MAETLWSAMLLWTGFRKGHGTGCGRKPFAYEAAQSRAGAWLPRWRKTWCTHELWHALVLAHPTVFPFTRSLRIESYLTHLVKYRKCAVHLLAPSFDADDVDDCRKHRHRILGSVVVVQSRPVVGMCRYAE